MASSPQTVSDLQAVLARDPANARALNSLGNLLVNSGDAAGGRVLLERAVAAEKNVPALWFNLSMAYRAENNLASELAALQQALTLDPYFIHALVNKAVAFERNGQLRDAARAYRNALGTVGDARDLPASVATALAHGKILVENQQQALLDHLHAKLSTARADVAADQLGRFDESLDILSGKKKYQPQVPTFYAYPSLPPIAFYERTHFPWLADVESVWQTMRAELQAALADDAAFVPYVAHPDGAPLNQWAELNNSRKWSAYFLHNNGRRVDDHAARCPATMAALALAQQPDIAGNAPNAFFSHLLPHTHIPPHTGMTNTRLVVHLPLIVPQGCHFRVGNHTRVWEEGKAWVFDDTIEHEAHNTSDESRIILIFDIWNPLLSETERHLITQTIAAYQDYYGADSDTLGTI
jgi:aspartate beta-hydroxylase